MSFLIHPHQNTCTYRTHEPHKYGVTATRFGGRPPSSGRTQLKFYSLKTSATAYSSMQVKISIRHYCHRAKSKFSCWSTAETRSCVSYIFLFCASNFLSNNNVRIIIPFQRTISHFITTHSAVLELLQTDRQADMLNLEETSIAQWILVYFQIGQMNFTMATAWNCQISNWV